MNRNVISARDLQPRERASTTPFGKAAATAPTTIDSQQSADTYVDRLVKYVPPDVIGAFLALEGSIGAAAAPGTIVLAWVVFAVMLLGTPLYLYRLGGVRKAPQLAISTGAFVVWALAYSGLPFSTFQIPLIYTTVLMGLYTFLIPLVEV
jgi:hypothetical protein